MKDRGAGRPLIALGGNPNVGKTTLFNLLTGSRARVGNYPGVTVERRVGQATLTGVGRVEVLDVPGTYSLVARTGEEQIALEAMVGLLGQRRPDVVVLCVDATQLVRGLYLVLQALELGLPVVVALTMIDEAADAVPDASALAARLGCPVVPISVPKKIGIQELRQALVGRLTEDGPGRFAPAQEIWRWKPSPALQEAIGRVRPTFPSDWPRSDAMALWALMSVGEGDELAGIPADLREAVAAAGIPGPALDDEVIKARYDWLDREIAPICRRPPDRRRSEAVDRVLIHPAAGLMVFFGIMFVVFQALFAWAEPAMDLVEGIFGAVGEGARRVLPEGLLADFVVEGLVAGMGAVIVFLPQILLLFFFLGLLEDSGYMARVAYLMDRIMRSMNLHGRAFVPILSGFACAVPAIMATRTMERRRDRLLTMLVVPLTTCSARLPVYTLIIASLFPSTLVLGFLPARGLLMVFMYAFGIAMALLAALVLSVAIKPLRARRLPFVIELPPYRLPRLKDVLHMMWERSRLFLTEAGRVIVVCSIVLWTLLNFPREPDFRAGAAPLPGTAAGVIAQAYAAEAGPDSLATSALSTRNDGAESAVARQAAQIQQSYAGRLGHAIEPIIKPLGFDWKIGVGLIGAFAAREVFVSTMGIIYGIGGDVDEQTASMRDRIRNERRADGSPLYTPLVGLSLMIFFALSCQCMSTLAVVRRETGSYRWPIFLFGYMTVLAWVVSLVVYQAGRWLGFA